MTDDPDMEPDMNKKFFVNYITRLDPKLLTDSGIKCFERFFRYVNLKNNLFIQKRNYVFTDNLDLIGLDYLWKVKIKKKLEKNNNCLIFLDSHFCQ